MRLPKAFNLLHAAAIAAVFVAYLTAIFTAACWDEDRDHAFNRTIIYHRGGQVVIRSPSDQLTTVNLFTHVDPDLIWFGCSAVLFGWFCWMIGRARAQRRKPPRGFPLD